jgi:hypothetical protein
MIPNLLSKMVEIGQFLSQFSAHKNDDTHEKCPGHLQPKIAMISP